MLSAVIEGAEHFLTSLYVHNAFAVRDLEIPIAQGEDRRRHLLLTGPNGSGKSSILAGVHATLKVYPDAPAFHLVPSKESIKQYESKLESEELQDKERYNLGLLLASVVGKVRRWETEPLVETRGLPALVDASQTVLAFMRAGRSLKLHRPKGPSRVDESHSPRAEGAASRLLQFLVNLRTEQAYAREDGDERTANRIGERFQDFEGRLRRILDDDGAQLQFERSSFDFKIEFSDGRVVEFDKLPDGISSILFMWATLMIPAETILRSGVSEPAGWAIIDEPELHLHARLQEMVLPFLITMFPNVQFIVATHSPAVLASIPDATIFDLRSREAIPSSDLQGIRYGTILTEHFGIETDFDLDTTRKLGRLKGLSDADPSPGTPEFEEMRALVQELSDRPHLLIAQLQKKLELDVA